MNLLRKIETSRTGNPRGFYGCFAYLSKLLFKEEPAGDILPQTDISR